MTIRVAAIAVSVFVTSLSMPTFAAENDGWQAMSARVDELLAAKWKEAAVKPARSASDAQFMRRTYLDLTGVIPSVGDARRFLADDKPDKRVRLIDRLLAKPNHATHLANVWRGVMLPRTNNNLQRLGQTAIFDRWLRDRFVDNTPYNMIVRELLTAGGQANQNGPVLYYTALELKPEKLAASTSSIFLGMQIQCAQCHNHPFDKWTQQDFWGYAAFFARLQRSPTGQQGVALQVVDANRGEVKLPESDEVVPPRFLDGKALPTDSGLSRRIQLADWITAPDNPYFARATVNRAWSLLFGYGLVDPVDDLGDHNPPSHPQILDELATDFVSHGFDLRRLLRLLAGTRAYGLSSVVDNDESVDPRLFSRMAVKSLTPEQVYDCLAMAVRLREAVGRAGATSTFGRRLDQRKQAFLAKFEAPTQRSTEFQSGIPQALTMMNGQFLVDATDIGRSDLLAALIDAPFFTNEQRVEIMFLSAVSRFPSEEERSRFVKYVESGGPTKDPNKALSDMLWALLNSSEFILNH